MDDFNCAEILKNILGDELYKDVVTKISKEVAEERNLNIELTDFYNDIVNNYCFIILMIGMAKRVEVENLKIKSKKVSWTLEMRDFIKKYDIFIRKVEDKKFNKINKML